MKELDWNRKKQLEDVWNKFLNCSFRGIETFSLK